MKGQRSRMFEYCVMILKKLAFSPRLFRKEYRKSFRFLSAEEHGAFRKWVRETFKGEGLRLNRRDINASDVNPSSR